MIIMYLNFGVFCPKFNAYGGAVQQGVAGGVNDASSGQAGQGKSLFFSLFGFVFGVKKVV